MGVVAGCCTRDVSLRREQDKTSSSTRNHRLRRSQGEGGRDVGGGERRAYSLLAAASSLVAWTAAGQIRAAPPPPADADMVRAGRSVDETTREGSVTSTRQAWAAPVAVRPNLAHGSAFV
jgi:hypothetical protein